MVFAAQRPIRVFGRGEGSFTVTFAHQQREAQCENGAWFVEMDPMPYGGPYTLTLTTEEGQTVLEDIYVGEVYLMSGQSNMQFKLSSSNYPKENYASNPMLRLFAAKRLEEGEPYTPADGWIVADKETVGNWTALGYLAGQLRAATGIAVGIIGCYQGASIIESWLPKGTLEKLGIEISPEGRNADHSSNIYKNWNRHGALYEGSLSTLFPFSLSAVVWYQGESNWYPEESRVYGKELEEMLRVWRQDFQDETLPFVIVQIADYVNRLGEGWTNIQTAQQEIQFRVPAVKTVISADISETDDIHPPTKDLLAARIAEALGQLL